MSDPKYLLEQQYASSEKLHTRASLHTRFGQNEMPWPRWVFDRLELSTTARVLELGCGSGTLWSENADRLGAGWEVLVTDFSTGMVETARSSLKGLSQFMFAVVDAQDIPYAEAAFD